MATHWQSKRKIGQFPLIHIAYSGSRVIEERCTARGVIAIGDEAIGVIAVGVDLAKGVIAVGMQAVGLIAVGIVALGVFSFASFGIGLLAAIGFITAAPISYGFIGVGIAALGQIALGVYAAGTYVSAGIFGVRPGWHFYEYDWLHRLGIDGQHLDSIVLAPFYVIVYLLPLIGGVMLVAVTLWTIFLLMKGAVKTGIGMFGEIVQDVLSIKPMLGMANVEVVKAKVLASRMTGAVLAALPVCEFQIEYTTLAGQHIKTKLVTHEIVDSSLQKPGAVISIAYDPAKPERPMLPYPEMKKAAS